MPNFSQASLDKLNTCHPDLVRLFSKAIESFDFTVLVGFRNKEEQDAAVAAKKSKDVWPKSKHNTSPSIAIDVVPYPINFDNKNRIRFFAGFIMGLARSMGIPLRWGGSWFQEIWATDFNDEKENLDDMDHFELVLSGVSK